jgi:hypothetical protein
MAFSLVGNGWMMAVLVFTSAAMFTSGLTTVTPATLRSQLKHPISPVDPLAARQELRLERQLAEGKQMTFRVCAANYIEAHKAEWKSEKQLQQWENTLQSYADPLFGHIPIGEIDENLILKVLLTI